MPARRALASVSAAKSEGGRMINRMGRCGAAADPFGNLFQHNSQLARHRPE